MKVVYTEQSITGLEELLSFLIEEQNLSIEKVVIIKNQLMDLADSLALNPMKGQREEYLQHLHQDHRRLISDYIKIIYKVEDNTVFITDFFDSRQDPSKMKGLL